MKNFLCNDDKVIEQGHTCCYWLSWAKATIHRRKIRDRGAEMFSGPYFSAGLVGILFS